MITVRKSQAISDERERDEVLAIIAQRTTYYETLFAHSPALPQITVHYEGVRPLVVRIVFAPAEGKPSVITVTSYASPAAATKHAFKKLRRVAKNYFAKVKKRQRSLRGTSMQHL